MIVVKVQINQEGKIESVLFGYFLIIPEHRWECYLAEDQVVWIYPVGHTFRNIWEKYQIEPFFPKKYSMCLFLFGYI